MCGTALKSSFSKKVKLKYETYFDWLGIQLGYKSMDDWYKLTMDELRKHNGSKFLSNYSSPAEILQKIYPQHNWMIWRFKDIPKGYWERLLSEKHESKAVLD